MAGFQTGALEEALGVEMTGVKVSAPVPPVNDSSWSEFLETAANSSGSNEELRKPTQIVAEWNKTQQQEGATFPTEIHIKFLDEQNKVVENLKTGDGPWQVRATLTNAADQKVTLMGSVTADVVKGIATFDTLAISHIGTYDIVFQVVRPDRFNITVTLTQIEVVKREMTVEMTPLTATVDIPFSLSVTMKDIIGGKTVTLQTVQGETWECKLLIDPVIEAPGNLTADESTVQVDIATGVATFINVAADALGYYAIKVHIKPSTGSYSIMKRAVLRVIVSQLKVVVKKSIQLKFAADFELIRDKQQQEFFQAALENHFYKIYRTNQVIFSNFKFWQGSIVTSFDAASSSDSTLEGMLDSIASDVKDQKTISFDGNNYQFEKSMLVDNKPYNNVEEAVSDIEVETPALLKTVVVLSTVYGQDNILSRPEVRSSSENVKRLGQS
ncbi:hypothetical protein LSAT2_023627 [Lamellibrachia satsuma]|nr:hypothetical protein LSAT2_023627 [Lamellibrachia satsuma]